jgi:hypothetical protein
MVCFEVVQDRFWNTRENSRFFKIGSATVIYLKLIRHAITNPSTSRLLHTFSISKAFDELETIMAQQVTQRKQQGTLHPLENVHS